MQHMVFTVFVYLRKYVYIFQLHITNTLSSSISLHPSHSSSHVNCSFRENLSFHLSHSHSHETFFVREILYRVCERISKTCVCLLYGAEQCNRIFGVTQTQ